MLPRCLAAVRRRRRRDRGRRHRLERPHGRDRALVRRTGDRARVDRLVLRRAQRLLRRRDRRLADVSRRRRGARRARTSSCCARSPARPGARRSTWSRPTTPASSATAPPSPTTRCACSATGPSTASRAACTSRSPQRCRLPARAHRARPTCASSTTATSAPCATRKEKSRRNIELLRAPAGRGAADARSCTSTSAPSTPPPATPRAALAEFERAWELVEDDPTQTSTWASCPRSAAGSSSALRVVRPLARGDRARPTRRSRASRASPTSSSSRRSRSLALGGIDERDRALSRGASRWATRPSRYTATVGCGTLPAARWRLAELAPRGAISRQARRAARLRASHEHPGFYGAVLPYAAALLRRRRRRPRRSSRESRSASRELTPTVRFMLGTALYECGAQRRPRSASSASCSSASRTRPARVALGEALLSQRRYAEARRAGRPGPRGQPARGERRRGPSCSAGSSVADIDGATSALTGRARRTPRPPSARLFKSWLTLLSGETLDHNLPSAGVGLLEVILEALLRVQEFKAFEVLVPLLERTDLPQREQRELLACLYLRRGFLQPRPPRSGWTSAPCSPTRARLSDSPRWPLAHGLPEDAVVFAHEALALEPANAEATAIAASGQQAAAALTRPTRPALLTRLAQVCELTPDYPA